MSELLAAAQRRLGRPGRPPTRDTERAHSDARARINSGENGGAPVQQSGRPSPAALPPRLLTLPMASAYLSLARSTLLELEASGALRRARVIVRGREIRKPTSRSLDTINRLPNRSVPLQSSGMHWSWLQNERLFIPKPWVGPVTVER